MVAAGQSVRLNFQITTEAETRISDYCKTTGRSASDIVRQLVSEYLDGFRELGPNVPALNGRRTNCTLPPRMVTKLDMRVRAIGPGASKGLVISNLLEDWKPDNVVASRLLANLVGAIRHRGGPDNSVYQRALTDAEIYLGRGSEND